MSAGRPDLAQVKAGASIIGLLAGVTRVVPAGPGKFMATCPFHVDRTPSLSVNEIKGLWCCHGCGAGGSAIDLVMRLDRVELAEAVERLAVRAGAAARPITPPPAATDHNIEFSRRIWREARPAAGTLVEAYLRSRGLTGPVPPTIQYHSGLLHSPTRLKLPAMIGAVTIWPGREIAGIHRTYLTAEGRKAPVTAPKMTLGSCKGGAIRLGPAGPDLVIGEGLETTFSVAQAVGRPGWAAMSASNLSALVLPQETTRVLIAADHDSSGTGEREARRAADRFTAEGRQVRVIMPAEPGRDFNDLIKEPV